MKTFLNMAQALAWLAQNAQGPVSVVVADTQYEACRNASLGWQVFLYAAQRWQSRPAVRTI